MPKRALAWPRRSASARSKFAGGDLRIGQLKLQIGDPCRILASFLRRQVDQLLDRDRCFLGPAKSSKPNDDIDDPSRDALLFVALGDDLDNRHIFCPFQQRRHDGNGPSCFGDTLPGDQDAVEKTSLSGRTNSLSRLLSQSLFFSPSSRLLSRRNGNSPCTAATSDQAFFCEPYRRTHQPLYGLNDGQRRVAFAARGADDRGRWLGRVRGHVEPARIRRGVVLAGTSASP
jgi:hypothetical protein